MLKSVLPNIDMLNISPIERMEKAETVVQWFGPENRGVQRLLVWKAAITLL